MSRGPGRAQRVILAAIAAPEAAASREDGTGPVGVPLTAVYRELYGTEQPTDTQRQSVDHAIRRLGDQVVSWHGPRGSSRYERTYQAQPAVIAACRDGEELDCRPCRYGNRPKPLAEPVEIAGTVWDGDRASIRRAYGDRADDELAMAERNGIHRWTDYRASARRERTRTVRHARREPGTVARPYTEQENAAAAAAFAALEAELMKALRGSSRE